MIFCVYLGSFHFDIGLVLREAKLINSIVVNYEVWHNVQLRHVQSLEKSDTDLLNKNIEITFKNSK